ncbi:MAG: hypothetical protein RLZZ522_1690 [Verrucomicrobiota bacterium]
MSEPIKKNMFTTDDGKNLTVTFILVSSLFLLWGFCNGMIDTMDKHFQDQLGLTKAQSAWVQFAHYIGYAIMALPAGLLTRRVGYRWGIILGLLLVAVGGFWFVPATQISQFWAFLMGVCLIAMGLTVLETVANPYTTLLGPKEYGATRINLAQSCNGIGWILGPIAGATYFYSEGGVEKAHGQLFIPYVGVGIIVLLIAVLFLRAQVPDIQVKDEYHTDDDQPVETIKNNALIFAMMMLNVAVLALSAYLVLHTILPSCGVDEKSVERNWWIFVLAVLACAPFLIATTKKLTTHSIWCHPHFSGAALTQFVYVAAQAGIFSFFINSMTVDKNNGYCMVPELPESWQHTFLKEWSWIETRTTLGESDLANLPALADRLKAKADPMATFLAGKLSKAATALLATGAADQSQLRAALMKDLNGILRGELSPKLTEDDLRDVPALATALIAKADPVSTFLSGQLSKGTTELLADFAKQPQSAPPAALKLALVRDFNKVIGGDILWQTERFAGLQLRDEVKQLAEKNRQQECWSRFNRMLLEDAYPAKLAPLGVICATEPSAGVPLSDETRTLMAELPTKDNARLRLNRLLLQDAFPQVLPYRDAALSISDKGAGILSSFAFGFFLLGRLVGAFLMKKSPAHRILGLFALANIAICALVIGKFGWASVMAVFLSYFFMSVMFPTIFALGIFGLGGQSKKKASAFIVMAITGGALMPKLMGHLGDAYDMSVAFWMPLACFVLITLYAVFWPKMSQSDGVFEIKGGGH